MNHTQLVPASPIAEESVEIPVMLSVDFSGASNRRVRLFGAIMRALSWSHSNDSPETFWTSLQWHAEDDTEILATCEQHLKIAASSARISDFKRTVIRVVPGANWRCLATSKR